MPDFVKYLFVALILIGFHIVSTALWKASAVKKIKIWCAANGAVISETQPVTFTMGRPANMRMVIVDKDAEYLCEFELFGWRELFESENHVKLISKKLSARADPATD
jgi:hypothetical protein